MGKKMEQIDMEKQATLPDMSKGQRTEKRTVRYIICDAGNIHVIEPCPRCHSNHGGLLAGTAIKGHKGMVTATCSDCGETAAYYIDSVEERVWATEPMAAKRGEIAHEHSR